MYIFGCGCVVETKLPVVFDVRALHSYGVEVAAECMPIKCAFVLVCERLYVVCESVSVLVLGTCGF